MSDQIILKVLVGSRGHLMHREDSDYDYRMVFATPTRELLSLSNAGKNTLWQEGETKGDDDVTGWEIGHFLKLVQQCNPTILEVMGAAPLEPYSGFEIGLQNLLPHIINPKRVWDAFTGYASNQWKKVQADKYYPHGNSIAVEKFALAADRVLRQGCVLLETGVMPIPLDEANRWSMEMFQHSVATGQMTLGQLLDHLNGLKVALWAAYQNNEDRWTPEPEKLNEFLLKVREHFWEKA